MSLFGIHVKVFMYLCPFAFFQNRIANLDVDIRVVPNNVEIEAPTIDDRKSSPVISLPLRLTNLMFKDSSLPSMRKCYNLHDFVTCFYNFDFSLHHALILHH